MLVTIQITLALIILKLKAVLCYVFKYIKLNALWHVNKMVFTCMLYRADWINKDKLLWDYLMFLDSVFLGSVYVRIFTCKETITLF
jgi:hypothetical protein